MVVLCAWLFDIALSAILNAGRFDLGFYAGRLLRALRREFRSGGTADRQRRPASPVVSLLGSAAPAGGLRKGASQRARAAVQRGGGIIQRRHHHQGARRHHHRLEPGRRTPVRIHRGGSGRPAHRHHRPARPARRGARNPRSDGPGRSRRTSRNLAACTRMARQVHVSLGISPIRSAAGTIVGASKIAHDITETQADAAGAQSGDRGAAAHLRDLAGPHPGDGHQGQRSFRSARAR